MANRSVAVMGKFVMMGLVELFMIGLSGQGQAQISKRYRAQSSKEDVVRKTSIS